MKKLFGFSGSDKPETHIETPVSRVHHSMIKWGQHRLDLNSFNKRLLPINKLPAQNMFDTVAFVLYCTEHERIATCKTEHKGGTYAIYLPFVYMDITIGWEEAIDDGLAMILSETDVNRRKLKIERQWEACILNIDRTQFPYTQKFITRLISLARVKSPICCKNTERINWVALNELKKGVENDWGMRIPLRKLTVNMEDVDSYQTIFESDLEWVMTFVPRDPPHNDEEDMLSKMNITERHIERVFADFLEHIFPAIHMSLHSFKNYFQKYGIFWDSSQSMKYMNAFNYKETKGILSFHEVLCGISCIEPDIYNGPIRNKFLFRYYDTDKDGFLSVVEFSALIKDLNPTASDNAINSLTKESMKQLNSSVKVSLDEFIKGIRSHKLRGTTALCRSPISIFNAISNRMASRTVGADPEVKTKVVEYVKSKAYEGVCGNCKKSTYEVAPFSVKIGPNGLCSDFQFLTESKS